MKFPSSHPLRRLLNYARGQRRQVQLATVYSILNKLFDIAPEILIGIAIDVVVQREDSFLASLGIVDVMSQLTLLAVLTLVIWACESLFEFLYMLRWRFLAQTIQHELRVNAYSHIQNLDVAYFEDRSTGGLVAILNDDINQLERFLDGGANALIQVATTVIAIGGIFFFLAPSVAAVAMLPIPVILFGAFHFQKKAQPLYADVREQASLLGGRLNNNLTGIATIKSYTMEQRELDAIRRQSDAYRDVNARAIRVSSAFIPIIRMAILAGFLATLVLGGWLTLQGDLSVGIYGVLVFLTQRLLWPLTSLAQTVDLYQRAMASTRRVLDLLATPTGIRTGPNRLRPSDVKGDLEFADVSFGYAAPVNSNASNPSLPRPLVLQNISLRIPAGTTTALVGPSGGGKSTLAKLLLRFYDPVNGRILLDGRPIEEFDVQDLRRTIGFVSQDVFLFHGTVRENIAFGSPQASDAQIETAARTAEAHEFIQQLPEGYDTIVGERGQKLSGGQRQRLSIARALLKNPPIMIFDEATSAVDNETEAAIQRSLERIAVGRTMLIIAHRLSTIRNADQICVIEGGVITERGTNAELIRNGGTYASLWKVQTGETAPSVGHAALP